MFSHLKLFLQKMISSPLFVGGMLLVLLSTGCAPTAAVAEEHTTPNLNHVESHVETIPLEGNPVTIEDSFAELTTTDEAAMMRLQTSGLEPGQVYTAWWVIINEPEQCSASPCSVPDIFVETDTTRSEITRADGVVADANGQAEFTGYLPKGTANKPWFGHGFADPITAEIHIVINGHGPVIPDLIGDMMTSYRGGCTTDSLPPAFPDTAKSDGTPGQNSCVLLQEAVFIQ